jgi:hypothetical protein
MPPDDESRRRIICLANSRKPGGRCIAGKMYFQGKFGKWLRPVSAREGEELSEVERLVGLETEPAMLDVLEFSIITAKPSHHQTENWIINPKLGMQKVGGISPQDLMLVLDEPISLWIVGSSSKRGKNDFVPEDRIEEVTDSLLIINPTFFAIHVLTDDFVGRQSRQVRGEFSHNGVEYNLKITDPVVEIKYRAREDGIYKIQNALLTISLTEKIFRPRYNHSAGFYKVIAGVIELPERGIK